MKHIMKYLGCKANVQFKPKSMLFIIFEFGRFFFLTHMVWCLVIARIFFDYF